MEKLRVIGGKTLLLKWLWSFLSDRHFRVSVSGVCSAPYFVTSSVLQDSVSGPLLFPLYVNHVPCNVPGKFKLPSDDLKVNVQMCLSTVCDIFRGITNDQKDNLTVYSAKLWGLKTNVDMCSTEVAKRALQLEYSGSILHLLFT